MSDEISSKQNQSSCVKSQNTTIMSENVESEPDDVTLTVTKQVDFAEEEEEDVQQEKDVQDDDAKESVQQDSPVPWRELFIVLLVFIADSFSFTTLAPYITEFVKHLGVVADNDEKRIGYFAGVIGSSYYVTQFFSAFFWGAVSDRVGRRPVLLCGVFGGFITSLLFGFSKNIYWAVATRALFGVLNGNLAVFKVYLAEISDKSNQARVFSYLGVSFSLTSIVGPLIGGFLAMPMTQYPALKSFMPSAIVKFLNYFPFILPNLLLSLINLLGFVLAAVYLKETNRNVLHRTPKQDEEGLNSEANDDEELQSTSTDLSSTTQASPVSESLQKQLLFEEESEYYEDEAIKSSKRVTWRQFILQRIRIENEIFKSYSPLSVVAIYSILGFVNIMYMEVFPIFLAMKPENGGLLFTQKQIGILNAICSVFVFIWTLFIAPKIIKRLGPSRCLRVSTVMIFPCAILIPFINKLYSVKALVWICLICVHTYRVMLVHIMASTISIMTNNSVSPANMGKLNGIGQSGVALTRALGPTVGGTLFSWSLAVNVFPFNIYFVWFLMCVVYGMLVVITLPLPKSLDSPKISQKQQEESAGEPPVKPVKQIEA